MKKLFAAFVFAALPALAMGAVSNYPLDKVDIDLRDKAALQDGARTFANYCMGCHGAKYQRYERVARDLGISEELMMANLVFTGAKIGDHMKSSMREKDGKLWFGAGLGLLIFVIRAFGNFPEGVAFAVLIMNAATPLIDNFTRQSIYGRPEREDQA